MTDQTKPAVAALAEAMFGKKAGPTYCYYAAQAINAIATNPDILREYGIGRLPTRSEWYAAINPNLYCNYYSQEWTHKMFQHLSDAGFIAPDPQPPEPTLREQVASMIQEGMDNGDYPDVIMRSLFAEFDITPKAAAEAGRSQ